MADRLEWATRGTGSLKDWKVRSTVLVPAVTFVAVIEALGFSSWWSLVEGRATSGSSNDRITRFPGRRWPTPPRRGFSNTLSEIYCVSTKIGH